jgi:FKBP-type peptidyl-prolyl cis-trans isomerase SlyD
MEIDTNCAVIFDYTITSQTGDILESGKDDPLCGYIHGTHTALPGVESVLQGQSVGFSTIIKLEPDQAFGHYNPDLIITVPVADFDGENLKIGMEFLMDEESMDGSDLDPMTWRITTLTDDTVTLDANHLYAGLTLVFDIKVKEVRVASDEEIEAGQLLGAEESRTSNET